MIFYLPAGRSQGVVRWTHLVAHLGTQGFICALWRSNRHFELIINDNTAILKMHRHSLTSSYRKIGP
jgi:hypothetical protein